MSRRSSPMPYNHFSHIGPGALKLRKLGLTWTVIGKRFGCSGETAKKMAEQVIEPPVAV